LKWYFGFRLDLAALLGLVRDVDRQRVQEGAGNAQGVGVEVTDHVAHGPACPLAGVLPHGEGTHVDPEAAMVEQQGVAVDQHGGVGRDHLLAQQPVLVPFERGALRTGRIEHDVEQVDEALGMQGFQLEVRCGQHALEGLAELFHALAFRFEFAVLAVRRQGALDRDDEHVVACQLRMLVEQRGPVAPGEVGHAPAGQPLEDLALPAFGPGIEPGLHVRRGEQADLDGGFLLQTLGEEAREDLEGALVHASGRRPGEHEAERVLVSVDAGLRIPGFIRQQIRQAVASHQPLHFRDRGRQAFERPLARGAALEPGAEPLHPAHGASLHRPASSRR